MLALTGHDARRWKPKRLPPGLFTVPATMARTGRRGRSVDAALYLRRRHVC